MQGLQDGEAQLEHVVKSMASLRAEFGERHAMLEERFSRSQNRVAQEIGEQRVQIVHTESRLQELQELQEAMANAKEEVEDAVQRNMEHVENRLRRTGRPSKTGPRQRQPCGAKVAIGAGARVPRAARALEGAMEKRPHPAHQPLRRIVSQSSNQEIGFAPPVETTSLPEIGIARCAPEVAVKPADMRIRVWVWKIWPP